MSRWASSRRASAFRYRKPTRTDARPRRSSGRSDERSRKGTVPFLLIQKLGQSPAALCSSSLCLAGRPSSGPSIVTRQWPTISLGAESREPASLGERRRTGQGGTNRRRLAGPSRAGPAGHAVGACGTRPASPICDRFRYRPLAPCRGRRMRCIGLYGPWPAEKHGPFGPQHINVQKMCMDGTTRQRRQASGIYMEAIDVPAVLRGVRPNAASAGSFGRGLGWASNIVCFCRGRAWRPILLSLLPCGGSNWKNPQAKRVRRLLFCPATITIANSSDNSVGV